jgi:hypothetical protein
MAKSSSKADTSELAATRVLRSSRRGSFAQHPLARLVRLGGNLL